MSIRFRRWCLWQFWQHSHVSFWYLLWLFVCYQWFGVKRAVVTIKADEWPFSKLSAVLTIPFLDGEVSCGACGACGAWQSHLDAWRLTPCLSTQRHHLWVLAEMRRSLRRSTKPSWHLSWPASRRVVQIHWHYGFLTLPNSSKSSCSVCKRGIVQGKKQSHKF